jgi:hypothetical protein
LQILLNESVVLLLHLVCVKIHNAAQRQLHVDRSHVLPTVKHFQQQSLVQVLLVRLQSAVNLLKRVQLVLERVLLVLRNQIQP